MGWESLVAPLAGALFGGASSGSSNQTATQSNDPWAPAQPWLIHNLGLGKSLQDQYMANPFSDSQKAAYGNSAALSNQFRSNLPNLFSNMSQQGYTRQNPVSSFHPYNFQAPTNSGASGGLFGGSTASGANYTPSSAVQGLITSAQDRAAGGGNKANVGAASSGGYTGTLPFDTGPMAAALGNLGFTKASDFIASQNDGYSPLSGNAGYADPRDAAAKGLGVANTAPVGVTTPPTPSPAAPVAPVFNPNLAPPGWTATSDDSGGTVWSSPNGKQTLIANPMNYAMLTGGLVGGSGGGGGNSTAQNFGLNWGGYQNSGGFGSDASA